MIMTLSERAALHRSSKIEAILCSSTASNELIKTFSLPARRKHMEKSVSIDSENIVSVDTEMAQSKWSQQVQALIDWFNSNEKKLPTSSFSLSEYESVKDTASFYARIKNDIANKPTKLRKWHLKDKIGKLKKMVGE